jgi:hypothetical protein
MSVASVLIHLRDETQCRTRVYDDFVTIEFANPDKTVGDISVFYNSLEQVKNHLAALQELAESFPK